MSELTEDDLLDFLLTARRDNDRTFIVRESQLCEECKKRLGLDAEKTAAVFKDGIK